MYAFNENQMFKNKYILIFEVNNSAFQWDMNFKGNMCKNLIFFYFGILNLPYREPLDSNLVVVFFSSR